MKKYDINVLIEAVNDYLYAENELKLFLRTWKGGWWTNKTDQEREDYTRYDRTSSEKWNTVNMMCRLLDIDSDKLIAARQEVLMEQLGVEQVYIDKVSGKSTERPQLKKMMEALRPGDTVIVEAISRFARNTKDLLTLVDRLVDKGVEFISKKENMDTTTPSGRFMLTVFGACAELERAYILDRQREGIEIKKAAGGYSGENHRGRSKTEMDWEMFESLMQKYLNQEISASRCAEQLGINQYTFWRRAREYREQHGIQPIQKEKERHNQPKRTRQRNSKYEREEKLKLATELEKIEHGYTDDSEH